MEKVIDIQNDDHLPVMEIDLLTELQDDFKDYTQTRRLADRIAAAGYKYPAFVWQSADGVVYVLDAHSRLRALRLLRDDGWRVPPIPVAHIRAANLTEARVELAHLNSRYADIQADSAFWQMLQADAAPIDLETVAIPELEGDARPQIDLAFDDEDEDEPRDAPNDRERAAFPLAIVLTAEQYAAWSAYKEQIGYSTDTKAFLTLLHEREA